MFFRDRRKWIVREMKSGMALCNINDTPINRYSILIGLRKGWLEQDVKNVEMAKLLIAVELMIAQLKREIPKDELEAWIKKNESP